MEFFGIQKVTLIDFPGEFACTLFTLGCNLRCPYCHNPELVIKDNTIQSIKWDEIYSYLEKRKSVLGGVCITGGEPLMHNEIIEVTEEIKALGLKIKIDTNGFFPENLKKIKADYIAMDIKTSLDKYNLVDSNYNEDKKKLLKDSINYIIESGIEHEFRTTAAPEIIEIDDIEKIAKLLKGAKKYYIAQFRPQKTLDSRWENVMPYPIEVLEKMRDIVKEHDIDCELRYGY